MFIVTCCDQGFTLAEDALAGLNIKKNELSGLRQRSGIDCRAVNGLLSEIRRYHQGVYRHSLNVARLSAQLAHRLNLQAIEVYTISIGALLHDVGKIRLPHAILDKQGTLTEDEWMMIKKHPQIGISMVSRYDWAQQLESMLLLHHERLDGEGYFSVSQDEIPLPTRIITLTDAFDAMFSPRPYQKQRDVRGCWEEIEKCSGTQFDPDLLQAFYSVISRGKS